jgi:hypothetical protein
LSTQPLSRSSPGRGPAPVTTRPSPPPSRSPSPSLSPSRGAVYKRAHPEKAREYARRSNAKRPDRDRSEHAPCPQCGQPKKRRGAELCGACRNRQRAAAAEVKNRLIERRWQEGRTMREIAAELGASWQTVQATISRLRERPDFDLPHRRTSEQVERMWVRRWGA